MSSIWGTQHCDVSSNRLGQPCPYDFDVCNTHGLSRHCLHSLPAAFLRRHSTFLVCLTSWGLYCSLGITLTISHITLQGLPAGILTLDTLPGLPALPLKSQWKPLWPCYSCVLHVYKTSTTRMIPRSAVSLSSSQAPLNHGFMSTWWLNPGKHFPKWPLRP
jgi:hypothetical protein